VKGIWAKNLPLATARQDMTLIFSIKKNVIDIIDSTNKSQVYTLDKQMKERGQ